VAANTRRRLFAPAHAGSSLADFLLFSSTLKMEAIRSSETSVNATSTWRHIQEDCFLQVFQKLKFGIHRQYDDLISLILSSRKESRLIMLLPS
jgi:hypothetical protein